MTQDPYASCQCGSGKKFKWCCQAIYPGIQAAWEQENNNQHETALRLMKQVVEQHPANPEPLGQLALLYTVHEQIDQAEAALEKAFEINPNYPFGLRLRARIRYGEGEYRGALLLARRAAEVYDPTAHEALGELAYLTFDCEMRANRPVAGRAALERAAQLLPADEGLRQGLEQVFGPDGRLPESARKSYALKKPAPTLPRLSELIKACEKQTQDTPASAAAWFNLGLSKAWNGDNAGAVDALERYFTLETDSAQAVEAAALSEVLRMGAGMEERCDYEEYTAVLRITNPQPIQRLLQEWHSQGRLLVIPTDQQGVFTAMLLELSKSGLVTVGRPATDVGRFAAYILAVGEVFRLNGSVKEPFHRVKDELRQKLGLALGEVQERRGQPAFHEMLTEALIFPVRTAEGGEEEAAQRVLEHATTFFEETWIKRPRKSLNNIAPVDATSSPGLRNRLLGVIQLMQEAAEGGLLGAYNFDQLRRKLGLLSAPAVASAASAGGAAVGDISAMNAADLAKLGVASLNDDQLEKAYQVAYRLDAGDLASQFAQALVARPVVAERPDRFPWFSYLIQKAIREGQADLALDQVNEGEKQDCEHNQGKRRNDYELWRAQAQAKRGSVADAEDTYRRLIERVPRDLKVRIKAVESMLSLKEPARALKLAEEALPVARETRDRDSEGHLQELTDRARRAAQ